MCIAAPARIMEINDKMATVDFGGIRQQVKLDLVSDVEIDKYVLVHSGYAIEVLTQEEAQEIYNLAPQTLWVEGEYTVL